MADSPRGTCAMCGKEDSRQCKRCKNIIYCSTDCQKADWETHKLLCRPYSEFNFSTRPSPAHFLAILFPAGAQKPKLIWLHCPFIDEGEGYGYQLADSDSLMGARSSSSTIQISHRLQRPLADTIRVDYRDRFLYDGSQLNQCIRAITNASAPAHWRGPVVAYGMQGDGSYPDTIRDLKTSDFRHIVDYFNWDRVKSEETKAFEKLLETQYGFQTISLNSNDEATGSKDASFKASTSKDTTSKDSTSKGTISKDSTSKDSTSKDATSKDATSKDATSKGTNDRDTVAGIRINCDGDFRILNRPMFESVQVPLSDRIFDGRIGKDRWTSDVAHRLGMPLFTRKYPEHPEWSQFGLNNNQQATFLHLNCKDRPGELFGWGWVPAAWQEPAGSILVVRQDRKPLHPLHIEALAEYCAVRVQSLFEAALEKSPSNNANDPRTMAIRNAALAKITRQDFELDNWPRALVRNRQEGGAPVESPFNI